MTIIFDILKQLISFLKFHFVRIGKWFAILFKRNRQLKKISFDYYKNWHSDNSYLAVEMKFKNAIYFKVNGFKSFDFNKQLIFDLKEIKTNNIKIEVFGFLQKQVSVIEIKKDFQLNSKPFRTSIKNISYVQLLRQKPQIKGLSFRINSNNPYINIQEPRLITQEIAINSKPIRVKFNQFKIQEYL